MADQTSGDADGRSAREAGPLGLKGSDLAQLTVPCYCAGPCRPRISTGKGIRDDYGIIIGPLKEKHPDRIVVAFMTLQLPDWMTCLHTVGTRVEVVYLERDGRKEVKKIILAMPDQPLPSWLI